ncbi:N-acetylneuraminate transport system permease protein [Streptococcus pyogenes JRS4]|nr:N-acetylneuraminate transport system permease protein [Streptococcus pyogenes MGAS10394]BAR43707.1 N-acetylneuraminate transport system permease protein [Streptococcus pyogenes JRS4]
MASFHGTCQMVTGKEPFLFLGEINRKRGISSERQ